VPDPKSQINEAFRVLKKGSYAAFSVWGRTENTQMFTIQNDVLEKHNYGIKLSSNSMGDKPQEAIQFLKEAGFERVHQWY